MRLTQYLPLCLAIAVYSWAVGSSSTVVEVFRHSLQERFNVPGEIQQAAFPGALYTARMEFDASGLLVTFGVYGERNEMSTQSPDEDGFVAIGFPPNVNRVLFEVRQRTQTGIIKHELELRAEEAVLWDEFFKFTDVLSLSFASNNNEISMPGEPVFFQFFGDDRTIEVMRKVTESLPVASLADRLRQIARRAEDPRGK